MSLVYEKAAEFKHIIRLFNTNIDGRRKVIYGLRQIRGIGRRFSTIICKIGRINPNSRAGELTEKDLQTVQNIIADPEGNGIPRWFLNRQRDFKTGLNYQLVSNLLDTKLREDLERMKKIRSHRGLRHFWNLRVRGQHTCTTGRKGVTMGVVRKK
eukprot:TRINITY_DN0_c259_g1_i3.p2 TRINITY_DN0_c259_g1~~TRINITY_DN0_c259_g1_i3.p2  ORF type:complete len:155 (-),score=1.49 TRINITY_DN0_c259_g1_i3:48-512(-)